MDSYLQSHSSESSDMYMLSEMLAMLETFSTEDLKGMPSELRKMLRQLMGTGMLSPSLERKLKTIL